MNRPHLTLNIRGRLVDFARPKVMGIINTTPDSFYKESRVKDSLAALSAAKRMIEDGADVLDIGACSTRPGVRPAGEKEEYARLAGVLEEIRTYYPDAILSVDTFRSNIALKCIENWNVDIINDISGGEGDPDMFDVIATTGVAYILQHMRGTPETMQSMTEYGDVTAELMTWFSKKLNDLHGKNVKDIIIDPGFGFAKTTEQNFQLLDRLGYFCELGCPVMAGLSRKSMIWKSLETTSEDSLAGTIALQAIAIDRGADLIRVHDVKEAVQTVRLMEKLN